MKRRLSTHELVLVAGALFIGCFLRFSDLNRLAIDQFDEGVYASSVWYHQVSDGVYPARHLYAPPALPAAIEVCSWFFSADVAPFIPSLIAGTLTILVVWGFTRTCFGMAAGLIVVLLAAFSDFHIVYSRTALTDVPALLWIVLSVWLGVSGIQQRHPRRMIYAGVVCSLAWWTKYSGWLPLAIISSGSAFWWIIAGRRDYPVGRLILQNFIMAAVAVACWLPWLWMLQDVGGYAAVRANHASYTTGFAQWQDNVITQFTWFYELDSWLGVLAFAIGLMFAGTHRWYEARSSTWNSGATAGAGVTPDLLAWFLMAAVWLPLMTLLVGLFGILMCVGIGGLAGQFLWPVLSQLKEGRPTTAGDAVDVKGLGAGPNSGESGYGGSTDVRDTADFHASPSIDPRLSVCTVTAWFCGMLVMTPTYTPFPRLMLPLVAALWIAAASGIGWWIEANINVARRSALSGIPSRRTPATRRIVGGAIMLAVFLAVMNQLDVGLSLTDKLTMLVAGRTPQIHEPRTGLRDAAREVAAICRPGNTAGDAGGGDANGESSSADSRPADDTSPTAVVYAFGEPALLYHLNQLGVASVPVADLTFPEAELHGRPLPTYLVFGPNALRTPGFMYDWVDRERRFEHLGDVEFAPSFVLLSNLFRPSWIQDHREEVAAQRLEVYRLKSAE